MGQAKQKAVAMKIWVDQQLPTLLSELAPYGIFPPNHIGEVIKLGTCSRAYPSGRVDTTEAHRKTVFARLVTNLPSKVRAEPIAQPQFEGELHEMFFQVQTGGIPKICCYSWLHAEKLQPHTGPVVAIALREVGVNSDLDSLVAAHYAPELETLNAKIAAMAQDNNLRAIGGFPVAPIAVPRKRDGGKL